MTTIQLDSDMTSELENGRKKIWKLNMVQVEVVGHGQQRINKGEEGKGKEG